MTTHSQIPALLAALLMASACEHKDEVHHTTHVEDHRAPALRAAQPVQSSLSATTNGQDTTPAGAPGPTAERDRGKEQALETMPASSGTEPASPRQQASWAQAAQRSSAGPSTVSSDRATTAVAHAVFRPRPGRRLAGRADLRESESGVQVHVSLRGVPKPLTELRLFRADACAAFGTGAGTFSSAHLASPEPLAEVGRLTLEQGRGERAYSLQNATLGAGDSSLRGKALVVFAEVRAHQGTVREPIACAAIPQT